MFGNAPGLGAAVETFEQAWSWGPFGSLIWTPGYIYSGALDSGNTPTTNLRPGLVMGIITATNAWTNYSPTATDGSQIAQGVLPIGLTMNDFLTGAGQAKAFGIVVGGRVQASKLINLDLQARSTLSPRFVFDDNFVGNYRFPGTRFATKTADYTVVAADNFTLFDNTGAVGAVNFTLPALANGYLFGFRVAADQSVTVTSAAGNDIIAFNDNAASSVAFSTGGAKVGGMFHIYSNPAGTAWIMETASAGANTVTVV
jgi:hypothetical protein